MIVCNTSPLILLGKVDLLWLPSDLYDNIHLPAAVLEENNAKPGPVANTVQNQIDQGTLTVRTPEETFLRRAEPGGESNRQPALSFRSYLSLNFILRELVP